VTLTSATGIQLNARTEVVGSVTTLADKTLTDRLPGITAKALARAAMKYTLAEGATRGAQQAAGKDAGPWVGLAVGLLAHGLAVGSEEADKRSWQTLPDEIHLARLWVPPGQYQASIRGAGRSNESVGTETGRKLTLDAGQTVFLLQRVMP